MIDTLSFSWVTAIGLLTVGCAGTPAAPPQISGSSAGARSTHLPESGHEEQPATSVEKNKNTVFPTQCAQGSNPCTMDPAFVKRLCVRSHPTVALHLFMKSSPWSRGYLTRRTQAWNASGGASDNSWLEFDEEVLVLLERATDKGGMQVSGAGGGYEALRWNGACVTLSKEELTYKKPPAAKSPTIEFRFLDDNVQEALRSDGQINEAFLARRKECKGATSGDVTAKCAKADAKLGEAVIEYIRRGGAVPAPQTPLE